MKNETFQRIASRYASVIGRHEGTTVVFSGENAYTDGKRINLPALPAGTMLSKHQFDVISGYLDHETSHVKRSTFGDISISQQEDPTLFWVFNVIEDLWIENGQIRMYPGSRYYLDALDITMKKKALYTHGYADPNVKVLGWFHNHLFREFRKIQDKDTDEILRTLDKDFKDVRKVLAEEVPGVDSTKKACELARKIYPMLKLKAEEQQKKDTESGDGEGGSESKGSGIEFDIAGQEIEAEMSEIIKGFIGEITKDENKNLDKEREAVATQDKTKPITNGAILPPVSTKDDKLFFKLDPNRDVYLKVKHEQSDVIKSLKKGMAIYLLSRGMRGWARGLEEGELDVEHLSVWATGDHRVYKQRRRTTMVNTALELCVDWSGSMNGKLTRIAMLVLAEATQAIRDLKVDITMFTTLDGKYYGFGGRAVPMLMAVVKEFDESYFRAAPRLGGILSQDNTPLGEAYALAFQRLVVRREERKILWLVSDGNPSFVLGEKKNKSDPNHDDRLLMERIHNKCIDNRIETVGILIGGSTSLDGFVDQVVKVDSPAQLPEGLLETMRGLGHVRPS